MAEKKVYLGSFNNHNKKILHEKMITYLKENKGEKFYYILPNGNLLKKYRRDFINEVEGTLDLNLFTFDDIVNNIIKGYSYKSIDDPLKGLIIRNILKNLSEKKEIEYYKDVTNMEGFVDSCINIIREIKRSLITPEIYLSKCPNDSYYKEIGVIYNEYERILLDKSLSDRENDYLNCINILSQNPDYLSDLEFIIIDEFYDFRPIESEIIKELSKKDIDIFINIPFGNSSDNVILQETLKKLKGFGFSIEYHEKNPSNIFESLSNKLFTYNDEKLDFIENIEVIKSPSCYIEMKKIFRDIKGKLHGGIDIDQMAVVLTSNSYMNSLFRVADEEGIPLKISKKTPVSMLPIVKELLNIIKTKMSNGLRENILNRIKSNYFPICDSYDKDEVEYFIRKLNFDSFDDLNKILEDNKSLSIPLRYIEILKELVDKIRVENDHISEENAVDIYNSIFIKFLDNYKIEERIFNMYQSLKDYDIFHRDLMSLEKLKDVLIRMDEIAIINDRMTLEDYYLVLEDYLKEESIIETDETIKGLEVLNPINSRGLSHKILYIVGLSQEEYPQLNNRSFFLSDDNYYTLKKIGIDIMNYHERFANEALKFSTLISSCKEQLYLSFNENSQEEGKNIPSMFLDDLLSKIRGEKIEEKVKYAILELDYLIKSDIDEITCEKDLINALLYKYYNGELEEKYLSILDQRYSEQIDKINKIINIEKKRTSDNYNQFSGLLDDKSIKNVIKTNLDDKVYSISYLEGYSMCPYYFLLHDYFKVEEMGRTPEDFSPIDIGTIYHGVLNNYYRKYQKDLIDNKDEFNFEETTEYLRNLVNKYSTMANFDISNKGDYLVVDNIYLRLEGFIKSDIERIKKYNIVPWEFEVEFGRENPFIIEMNNKKISFRGKIDRIDKIADEDKFIVIDYKSSSYGKKDLTQIVNGLSLQLPVYILSQGDKNVIAGSYSILSNGEFSTAMGILGEANFITKRQKGALEKDQWDNTLENSKNIIFNIIQNINNGNFSVNPLECSEYCPYKDICRFDKVMEVN
ncbi:PD-(D/E)XK nuclease family protein [Tissierella sp. Yu-01]|uniref:PD-(D/E)XK nuclease family protein n=1 Tax=Tissierella sp. Yu-01 TaxID=3035694 RepID=UPI00240E40F4|nr:PD-(D/E)XK nuclease family protein [Tissierella sp. Yu-01]WFA09410.1 PD-(D/E)XK nuclease family protein [Tissierella sp. Yu-01]